MKFNEEQLNVYNKWKNREIPQVKGRDEFVGYLTQIFISSQMKNGLTDNIQDYVNKYFSNYKENKWAVAINIIKRNYKHFRLIGWTEKDYVRTLSLTIALDMMFSKENLIKVFNDYKMGLYDDYFGE
jgi:hypothetical protein